MTTTAARTTYATVGSFDHTELSKLATYRPLRDALSDFANEVGAKTETTLTQSLGAIRDMALSTPYADCCVPCRDDGGGLAVYSPYAIDRRAEGRLVCTYRCDRGHRWICNYNAHMFEEKP